MNGSQYEDLNRQMAKLADGDRSAFEPIFELVWPSVKNFAERALNNSPDAEDAAQSALLKIFAQASGYKKELDALPWILTVTAFECKTIRQKHTRRREQGAMDLVIDQATDNSLNSEEILIEKDLYAALNKVIESLPLSDQETIKVAFERKERPNIPPATFRKRVERTIKKIETLWSENYAR